MWSECFFLFKIKVKCYVSVIEIYFFVYLAQFIIPLTFNVNFFSYNWLIIIKK